MKKLFFLAVFFSLFLNPAFETYAQSLSTTEPSTSKFDMTGFPQWAKDMRRFDIITFGSFPFSLFFVSFIMDSVRWYNENRWDMSEQGRRYAPWPMKSASAYEMSNNEYAQMFLIAAGLSLCIATIDLLIVHSKRNKERRRLESLPSGSYEIEKKPYGEDENPEKTEE